MVARAAKQAVIPGSQYDWRGLFARLPKFLVGVAVIAICVLGFMKLSDPGLLPIQKIRAQGTFIHLAEEMLLSRAGNIQGGYFNIDVSSVQENIESLPWVDKAYVRRMWPDTLMITVKEQQATARWHDNGLINSRGELFFPDKSSFPQGLPKFSGPVGTHQQLIKHYKNMNQLLVKAGLTIQTIKMDARRALSLQFDNGLKILLGRDAHDLRLERFIKVYGKVLVTETDQLQQIDMRYANGFTILRK